MNKDVVNPILSAVNAILSFPTTETLLCEGETVSYSDLKGCLGSRLVVEDKRLCGSHVRSLAESIKKHKAVLLPIIVGQTDNIFYVKDGFHRLAAVELIKSQDPTAEIIIKVKLNTNNNV